MPASTSRLPGARLGVVAAVLGELRFELGGVHVVVVGRVRVRVDGVAFLHCAPHLDVTLQHHVQHPLIFPGELILVQLAHSQPGLEHHLAGTLLEVAGEHFHQRRLAGAVGADQSIAVAVRELDGDALEQRLGAELDGDVGGREHCVAQLPQCGPRDSSTSS